MNLKMPEELKQELRDVMQNMEDRRSDMEVHQQTMINHLINRAYYAGYAQAEIDGKVKPEPKISIEYSEEVLGA